MDEPQGLVDSSFVRKDFYLEPPAKDATVEVWNEWLRKDRAAAIAAKRAHTKTLAHSEIPETMRASVVVKIGGVYKQTAMIGLVSEGEDRTRLEAAVEADQDRIVEAKQTAANTIKPSRKRKSGAARRRNR